MDMRTYYLFLGFHSFLIGLFPFFLPVYLVKSGYTLSEISWFIGCTGIGFCCTLAIWERFCRRLQFRTTLIFSFGVLLLLVSCLAAGISTPVLSVLALINGAYNCLFWMVQRILFYMTSNGENSGRKFGNFQIFVMIILKAGILIGGMMLEYTGTIGIVVLSIVVAATAVVLLEQIPVVPSLPRQLQNSPPWSLHRLIAFKDRFRSRLIFIIDGVFLYLESYFWLITLFFIVRQSFWQLGILVFSLAITFSLLFYLIKNRIDHLHIEKTYQIAVLIYALSWLLRSVVARTPSGIELYLLLIVITFATSFFRLAFNKRFFDNARATSGYSYIIYKSYSSQLCIGLFFCTFAILTDNLNMMQLYLPHIYLATGPFALMYLIYRQATHYVPATDTNISRDTDRKGFCA